MGEKKLTMQIQPQVQEKPTSFMQEKPRFGSPESNDHQPQQQQPQKRPNESNSEQKGKSTKTREYESGGKYEQENEEKMSGDHNSNNNGEILGPRERLKRHRREVAGQVWIPDMWGQEDFLKDWIDCSAFDASLVLQGIMLARASLMEEGRRSNSNTLTVENSC